MLNCVSKIPSTGDSEIVPSKLLTSQRRRQAPGGQSSAVVILEVCAILGTGTSEAQMVGLNIQVADTVILLGTFKVTIWDTGTIIFPISSFPGDEVP